MRRNAKIMNVKSLAHFRVSDGSPTHNHSSIKKKKHYEMMEELCLVRTVELSGPWAKCLLSPGTHLEGQRVGSIHRLLVSEWKLIKVPRRN